MKNIKIVGIVLIFIGIIIISYTFGTKYWATQKQNNMTKKYEEKIKNHRQMAESTFKNLDKSLTEDLRDENNSNKQPSFEDSDAIGILIIPKIDLKVAVSEGTDMETLKYAVGHFEGTAMPGEKGNLCIAGHRSYTFGEYFNRLDELEKGDEIILETIDESYKYIVYDVKVVLPDQIEVLNPTEDATMTLVTCTPIRVATHRLIINAKLEN
ncbi:MAG: class D sortase [Clostridiaceae bacterium]